MLMGPLHELFREEQVYSLRDCPSTSMLHQMFYAFKLRQPSPFLPLSFIILHYALLSSSLSYYFTCLQIDKEDMILQRAKSPPTTASRLCSLHLPTHIQANCGVRYSTYMHACASGKCKLDAVFRLRGIECDLVRLSALKVSGPRKL